MNRREREHTTMVAAELRDSAGYSEFTTWHPWVAPYLCAWKDASVDRCWFLRAVKPSRISCYFFFSSKPAATTIGILSSPYTSRYSLISAPSGSFFPGQQTLFFLESTNPPNKSWAINKAAHEKLRSSTSMFLRFIPFASGICWISNNYLLQI